MVTLLLTERAPLQLDKRFCAIAAADGNLEVLMWLRTLKCAWDEDTFRQAFYNGSVFRRTYHKTLAVETCMYCIPQS